MHIVQISLYNSILQFEIWGVLKTGEVPHNPDTAYSWFTYTLTEKSTDKITENQ